ncbi:MAG: hypothetical protein U0R49_03830 [Fimbriimonadales bacterium]
MRAFDPVALFIAIGVPVALSVVAVICFALQRREFGIRFAIVAVATVLLSATYLLVDRLAGFGSMTSLYIGAIVAALLGVLTGKLIRRGS